MCESITNTEWFLGNNYSLDNPRLLQILKTHRENLRTWRSDASANIVKTLMTFRECLDEKNNPFFTEKREEYSRLWACIMCWSYHSFY